MKPVEKQSKKEKFKHQRERNASISKKKNNESTFTRQNILLGLVVAILGFVLYSNTLNHAFVLDDNSAIENNWVVKQGVSAIPTLMQTSYRYGFWKGEDELYRPLSLCIFAMLYEIFGDNTVPYHLLNIILYAITGFVLFIVLRKLLTNFSVIIPFISAIIFIAHPVHTEVVANIKSLDEILSCLFILVTIFLIHNYLKSNSSKSLVLAAFLYLLAFLSKESSIYMLAIFPLIIYYFIPFKPSKLALVTSIMFIPALCYFVMRNHALGGMIGKSQFAMIDNVLVSAPDIMTRWATAILIMGKYLLVLFFPRILSSDYTFPQLELTNWSNPLVWMSLIIHAALLVFAIIKLRSRTLISFGILFYLVSMSLYSNIFILIGSPFAERFLYTPSIGFSIVMGVVIYWVTIKLHRVKAEQGWDWSLIKSKYLIALLLLILIPYSFKTIARNRDWKNNYSLYEADVKNSPRCARLHFFYANEIRKEKAMKTPDPNLKQQLLEQSKKEYEKAIELYPGYGDAYGQLGMSYYRMGDRQRAFELYTEAIRLKSTSGITYNNMGVLYSEAGQHKNALDYYNKAVFFDPYYFDAWKNLGNTYAELGQNNKSIEAFRKALFYKEENAEVNYFLAVGLQQNGQNSEAEIYFQKARKLNARFEN